MLPQLLITVVWLVISGIALWLDPSPRGHGTHMQLGFAPCPSVALLGRLCPGCGMTTSFAHMVRLQFVDAFQANAFGPVLYGGLTLMGVIMGWGSISRRQVMVNGQRLEGLLLVVLLSFMAYAAYRFFSPTG